MGGDSCRLPRAAVGGAVFGFFVAALTNAALLEISINHTFAAFFGIVVFFPLGLLILHRVCRFRQHVRCFSLVALLAVTVLSAGLLCVAFQRAWFTDLPSTYRAPLYAVLGVALSFAMSFSSVEVLNWCVTRREAATSRRGLVFRGGGGGAGADAGSTTGDHSVLVSNPTQVLLLAVSSVVLGFVLGLVFGTSGVGRGRHGYARATLGREEAVVVPIGVALGSVAAVLNELLRRVNAPTDWTGSPLDDDYKDPQPGSWDHPDTDAESTLQRMGRLIYSRDALYRP